MALPSWDKHAAEEAADTQRKVKWGWPSKEDRDGRNRGFTEAPLDGTLELKPCESPNSAFHNSSTGE